MIYLIWCSVWCPHSFYFRFSWFQYLTLWQVCCGGRWCYHLVLSRSLALVKVWGFRAYGFGSRPFNICTCYYLELEPPNPPIRPHFPLVYPDVCWYPSNHICSHWIAAEAKTMVVEARKKGTWVLLQNCHLYKMLSRSQLLGVKHLGGGIRSQPIEIGDSRMTRFFTLVGGFKYLKVLSTLSRLPKHVCVNTIFGLFDLNMDRFQLLQYYDLGSVLSKFQQEGFFDVHKDATLMMGVLWILMHAFWMVWILSATLSTLESRVSVSTHVALCCSL